MNTNLLARHYDTLTPRERLPLLLAAHARQDQAEHDRLTRSAPRLAYGVPDYYGLAEGFCAMTNWHALKMLDLSCLYWHTITAICDRGLPKEEDRLTRTLYLLSYLLLARVEGWRLTCADYGIDPCATLATSPGWDTVRAKLELVQSEYLTRESFAAHLSEGPDGKAPDLPTPEDVQAGYQEAVEFHRTTWK